MPHVGKLLVAGACALVVTGCAQQYVREEPHHFSKDARGNRIACYPTDIADEFECVPVRRAYGYGYPHGYYDPYWMGGFYGWPYYHPHYVYVEERPPSPGPSTPPTHWRPRAKRK